MNAVPVISVVGKTNVGKTTLLEKLLPELKRRGYRVATIKHDAHRFELDTPGKDTWRHAQAGSDCVVISSAEKLAMIQKVEGELTLDDIVARLPPVDIVLTEGYKRQDKPKIEVSRREMGAAAPVHARGADLPGHGPVVRHGRAAVRYQRRGRDRRSD